MPGTKQALCKCSFVLLWYCLATNNLFTIVYAVLAILMHTQGLLM